VTPLKSGRMGEREHAEVAGASITVADGSFA